MESFFGSLKAERVHGQHYPIREAAKRELFAYIGGYYNRQRIHSVLGCNPPEQAELRIAQPGVHSPKESSEAIPCNGNT